MKTPVPESALLKRRGMVKWLFAGDSITQGALHTFGLRAYPEIFAERVRYELGRKSDVIINTAYSGATSVDVLEQVREAFEFFSPDAIFLMMGINDSPRSRKKLRNRFEDTLAAVVELAQFRNATVICQTPPPIDAVNVPDYQDGYQDILAKIRRQAAVLSVTLVDHHAIWSREIEKKSHGRFLWFMSDAIHPNHFGHTFIARTLFKAFGVLDETKPTCRQFFP